MRLPSQPANPLFFFHGVCLQWGQRYPLIWVFTFFCVHLKAGVIKFFLSMPLVNIYFVSLHLHYSFYFLLPKVMIREGLPITRLFIQAFTRCLLTCGWFKNKHHLWPRVKYTVPLQLTLSILPLLLWINSFKWKEKLSTTERRIGCICTKFRTSVDSREFILTESLVLFLVCWLEEITQANKKRGNQNKQTRVD